MNFERRAWIVARVLAVLIVIVSLRAAYWQVIRGYSLQPVALDPVKAYRVYSDLQGLPTPLPGSEAPADPVTSLASLPQPVIQRTVEMLSAIKRGVILDREGNILAEDIGESGEYTRVYRDPSLAHLIGYTSALRTGVSGLEATYNETLLGFNRADTEIDRMFHRNIDGSQLVLTIDPDIQRASAEALAGRPGAVIVLDGKTGAVLAMTSAPAFDPNQMLANGYISSLGDGTLLNRATQALYSPGSTWKTVTLIAALDTGQVKPDTVFDFGEPRVREDGRIYYVYEVDGGIIPDPNHQENRLDLAMSYARSANAAFAKMGDDMSPEVMIDYSARLGFDTPDYSRRFPLELPVSEPQLANDLDSIRTNNLLRASTGFGQGELLTTPINMAMVVQSVVNEGSIPVPYIVQEIRHPNGRVIRERPNRHIVRGIMKAETAKQVKDMMAVVIDEQGGDAAYSGYSDAVVGAKTGTAQVGGDLEPHGWLMGYAERGEKSLVIVVVLEHGGSSRQTIPLFQQVTTAAAKKYFENNQ